MRYFWTMPLSLVRSSLVAVAFLMNLLLHSLPFFRISFIISFSIFYSTSSSLTPTPFYLSPIFYFSLCSNLYFNYWFLRFYSYPP